MIGFIAYFAVNVMMTAVGETVPDVPTDPQDLTANLEYVAYPAFVRYQGNNMNASSIIDLQVYHDLIFSGYGNWDGNQGPVTMVPLEPNLKTLTDEGELGTDSTETLRVFEDGNLYVPATDRRELHANRGLFFRRNASGEWHTHTAIVVDNDVSTHFWDMMDFNGRLFLAGYGLASSSDGGTTWSRVESNPQNTRYLGFIKCGDELFCRDQSFIAFDYRTGKLVTGITNYNSYYWHWNKSTSLFDKINNNDYSEINGGVDRSSWALSYADLTNYSTTSGHPWHCTPFKDRSLYILGSANAITVSGKKRAPSGTFPAVLITAWAEGGMLKGKGVDLEGAYPYDLTVFGDVIYALTFKYKSDSQTVEHAVWKSTDGETFTKIFFFDFQQVMASIEYHNGYFYFGVAHLGAQPLLGTLAAKTDLSGRIYRVWCPQEKVQVVATPVATSVSEGTSTQVGYKLSAKPESDVTLVVSRTDGNANFTVTPASLTFTPSNWNVAQNVTVSLADTATGDATPVAITCGVATPDSVRGAFASESVTASSVVMTPVVNDFAPTIASVEVRNRLVPASVSAALDSFGAENGVAKNSATLVVTAYSDAGKTQVVATKSASVTALGESVSVSFPELEPGRLYYSDITAKTTDALATVVSHDFTSPIATREEDLVDLTDDLTKREGITGNSNVRPYDSSGAWDNTTSVTFGGYKRPSYSVYEFTEPTVANGFGLLGIADQQESRMPLNYSFAGSNDTNGEWTVLFAVTNAPVWGAEGEWRRHLCDNMTAYRFYKVSLDENRVKGAGDAHVYSAEAELYFIGEPETPPDEPEEPETPQDLTAQLEFVGNPTLERWLTRGTANSILDIEVNDDRLFFACGEWSGNSGPVFMKSFDPYFCTYTNEYAAGTEGVEVLRTFSDGGLYFPAIDHMDKGSYDNGYWFKRTKGGEWSAGFANGTSKKLYTHVYDMQQFGDWMFLYSGCPVGSKDGGANWLRLDGLSSNKQFGSLLRCGDELFCVEAYPIDFGTGTNPAATPISDPYTRHGPTVWRWNAATEMFASTVEPTWDNLAPEIVLSDCYLVTTDASQVGRPGRFWHTTPFKNRCLYVIGDEYSDRTYTVNGKSVTLKPIGTHPEIAVSAYAENGALKGTRIHLPAKTWPIDFTVVGDTAYMLAFSYVPDTQMVRHGVWKSTDGVGFTEILTVDYPQVMQAFDYHMGYFYFGVAHQNAEPNLGPIKSGTKEPAGDIYRVYCPQEPVTAVASVSTLPISEGGSSVINYTLSAQPAADVTLAVRLLGGAGLTLSTESIVFTRANWNSPHPVTVTYPQNDRRDAESVVLVCGIETPTSLRGRFDSPEVTASIVKVEPADDDRAPTISAETFDNAKIPFTYTATLTDFGSLNGQAAGSATVTLTAYDDDACTHAVDSDSKTVTTTGEVSLTLTNLVRGAWYTFVAEARSSEESAVRSSMRLRAPIGTAAQLVDLTDDLSNRAGTYATNAAIGPSGNSGAWDNDLTKYFGGYKNPREAIYEFNTPMVVNGFGLRGMGKLSDEQDRHPSGYSLYGTADTNDTWTLLAQVTGDPIWSPSGEWRRIYAPNTTAYKYYKLTLDSAQMPNMSRIAAAEVELYFIGESETPPEEPEEPVGLNNLGAPEGDRFELPLQQTWPAADYGAEVCLWRYDRYAALSFGHDDNCAWDIPFLLREAERNGIKLTWWLITANVGQSDAGGTWEKWRECFAAGHGIESHSHTHEWHGGGRTVPDAAAAAGMSEADYVEFCMYSNSLAVIRENIPGCKPSTLAFPGGESYPEIANRYFVSGRSVNPYINRANAIDYRNVSASSSGIDPGYINAMLGGRGGSKALADWKAKFNDESNYRGWFVPFQHTESTHDGLPNAGHEEGVSQQIERMALLGRHRRHLWLGTYGAVAKYGQSRDTASLTVGTKTASRITFTLQDQMRDDWYDEPLTVKVRLPAVWAQSGVAATQGDKTLDAYYVEHGGAKYALVNAVPDRGEVTLVPAAANSGTWDETSYETPTYTYQVRFFDTDGTTLLKTIIAHPINTSAAELAPVIYRPGYRLSWQTADGVSIDDITDDVDFTAVWTATDERPRAVFVDDSTGEELTFVEAVYGDRPAQPANLPAREGYIAYWEPDLGPIVSNTQFRVKYMRDDDPIPGAIIVRTAAEFCDAMANHPDAVIRMVRDIDISGYGYTAAPEFSGTFKAYGHILTGLGDTSLCVTNSGAFVGLKVLGDSDAEHPVLVSGYGVFAVVSDAGVFTDCRVDGYAIRANAQYLAYGVFVGTALKGSAFTNCTVGATCSIDQGGKPNNEIGGFVGLLNVTDPSGTLITFAHCTNEAPILATGDYNTAHGDGGFIGRASGCGASSTPEISFVDCAEKGLVSSSGGNSNLGGYIGNVPGLTVKSSCKVIFEGCTTKMPVGEKASKIGEWIGLAANVVVEHKEYIPPEPPEDPPDDPPVEPDDPPVEPEKPTEFVTNDWFDVEFEDDGYKAGSDWTKTSTDKSGGTWSGDDGEATTLDGTTFVVTLTDTFEGELRYTPSKASEADADVVVEGTMEVSAAARDIRPEDVTFALTFESKQSGNLTPVAYIGGAWHSFGTTGFAADAWVDWKVEVDQASTNAPRIKVTVAQKGGIVETSGWIAGGFAAKQVSVLSYIGVGSFGDFKARYLTVKGGEVIELVPPEFAADGSALGFKPGIGETRMFTLKIMNPVKGAYYTVLTSTTLEGPFLPEGDSVLFDQDSGTLTLEVSADTPQKFAKILVSASPID